MLQNLKSMFVRRLSVICELRLDPADRGLWGDFVIVRSAALKISTLLQN